MSDLCQDCGCTLEKAKYWRCGDEGYEHLCEKCWNGTVVVDRDDYFNMCDDPHEDGLMCRDCRDHFGLMCERTLKSAGLVLMSN